MAENDNEAEESSTLVLHDDIDKVLCHVKQLIATSEENANDILCTSKTTQNGYQNIVTEEHSDILDDSTSKVESNTRLRLSEAKNGDFGLNEVFLIVNEFEKLRNLYKELEKEVKTSSELKNKNESVSLDEDKKFDYDELRNEIVSLKADNERLTNRIQEFEVEQSKQSVDDTLQEALQKTIDRLELDVKQQKKLTNEANERLNAHDAAAKRAISVLQKEMGSRIEQVAKMHRESVSEKDAYIIKISKLEQLIDELQKNKHTQNRKLSENQSEIENLRNIVKSKDSDYIKIVAANETMEKENSKLTKKVESHINDVEAQEMKVKWAQNKLKSEMDAHKETKKQITLLTTKLQESKEEGNQIRVNCQEMIERYQGDEEIESVRLNKEVEEKTNEIKQIESEIKKYEKINEKKDKELSTMKEENLNLSKELFNTKNNVALLEGKNMNLTNDIIERDKDCAEYKTTTEDLKEKLKELNDIRSQVIEYEGEVKKLTNENATLQQQINEYEIELNEHKSKQQDILSYTQNLTESNASSKAVATDLQTSLDTLLVEKAELEHQFRLAEKRDKEQIHQLETDKHTLSKKVEELMNQYELKVNTINTLSASLEETQDQLKVLKKKNTSQMKDLQRQLHQTTRKIEKLENSSKNGSMENLSIRSRTSSNNSLERLHPNDSPPNSSSSPQMIHETVLIPQDHNIIQPHRQQFQEIEVDKKVLVERICKLQRQHAKKNEKLEFLEEHINHLTEDLQRKSKIIQSYISREEAGSLAPDRFDRNKADVSQHGGIMSSVYSAKQTDKGMTLELSLTINRKLQAVLEDTILKNIMLKENVNTLGMEIAKLQEEVKSLKVS